MISSDSQKLGPITPSIEGSTSATKGKSRTSLVFSLLEKVKKPKSFI